MLVLLLGAAATPTADGADDFYLRLLEQGAQDLELGLLDGALQKLRIASFGFLEEPVLLAQALTQLGLAQARSGHSSDLTDTVLRLAEIEQRFGAYSDVDEASRLVFESSLRDSLPEELLARLAIFRHLTIQPEAAESEAETLTPKQRKKMLEQELAADPGNPGALLALARIHYSSGKPKPAAALLDRLLAAEPGNEEAICLRAGLAIEKEECAPALAGLDLCEPLTSTGNEDAFVLDCLTEARRVEEAASYLDRIPEERLETRKLARAARRLADLQAASTAELVELPDGAAQVDEQEAPAGPGSPQAADSTRAEQPGAEPAANRESPPSQPSPDLEERMATLRTKVSESRFREQLDQALEQAVSLAESNPESTEAQHLAAEIAYLSADWQMVADFFDRGGPPDPDRPELAFYLAVAHYELGNRLEAAAILQPVVSRLARNPFVDEYIGRILENPPS